MLSDYEELRKKQLEFLKFWNDSFVKLRRKKLGHDHFSLNTKEIYALRIDDLISFCDKEKMSFEYSNWMQEIIFNDIKY